MYWCLFITFNNSFFEPGLILHSHDHHFTYDQLRNKRKNLASQLGKVSTEVLNGTGGGTAIAAACKKHHISLRVWGVSAVSFTCSSPVLLGNYCTYIEVKICSEVWLLDILRSLTAFALFSYSLPLCQIMGEHVMKRPRNNPPAGSIVDTSGGSRR